MKHSGLPGWAALLSLSLLCVLTTCVFTKKDTAAINTNPIPVIELRGTAYERGLQHGQKLKREIEEVFAKWKLSLRNTLKRDADSLIKGFIASSDFELSIKKWTPELLEEIKGISDGSGQKYADVYAFQLLDEFWVYTDSLQNSGKHHCSGIGVPSSATHPAYTAQNMDLENYMNGYQVLLHISGDNETPEQYLFTCAGLIVTTGMNEFGISVNPNTLMELNASPDGLPVACVIRGILKLRDPEKILLFLNSVKYASGQNYIVGIRDSIYDFETSSGQCVRFQPDNAVKGLVYHTNHSLKNHDVKPWYREYHQNVIAGQLKSLNSEIRFSSLENRLKIVPDSINDGTLKSTLRSKDSEENPVCRTYYEGAGIFTFGSVIYTLTGVPSVQVTKGSPDLTEYKEYFFSERQNKK